MTTEPQPSRIQLTVEISPELHSRIETAAGQKDLSIQEYIEKILEQYVHPSRPVSREAVERLLQSRERRIKARQGRPSLDSTEMIRQMREERSQYLAEL